MGHICLQRHKLIPHYEPKHTIITIPKPYSVPYFDPPQPQNFNY